MQNEFKDTLLMPVEGVPEDTYDNIPEDEIDEVLETQEPDEKVEADHVDYVLSEILSEEEIDMIEEKLAQDDELSVLFDRVVLAASEFSGAGEVEGLGDGTSDSIPARLSDGEFVFTKKAVDVIGADALQVIMDEAEREYDTRMPKAMGGEVKPPMKPELSNAQEDEVYSSMLAANRMPSVQKG